MSKTIYSEGHKYLVKQLNIARTEAGLSQKDVAIILDKTQSYISKMESGQVRIDIIQLKELANIYRKDLEFFILK